MQKCTVAFISLTQSYPESCSAGNLLPRKNTYVWEHYQQLYTETEYSIHPAFINQMW